jgi:D-alanyl-D-alanine carboxypeptidase
MTRLRRPPIAGLALAAVAATLLLIAPLARWIAAPERGPSANPGSSTQELLDHWRIRAGAPAAVMAEEAPGMPRWAGASGTLLRGGGPAVSTSSRFRVASITKLFVATVVLQLVQEGLISTRDRLDRYLPGFPGADRITIADLLAHSSGVPDYGQLDGFSRRLIRDRQHHFTDPQVLALISGSKRQFEPGAGYAYSNSDFLLLSEVIRAVTGQAWAMQLRRRLLDPLGLRDTYVAGFEKPSAAVIPGYFDADGDGHEENIETGRPWPALETSESAAGAIVSTADDLVTFGEALYHGRLLEPSMLRLMTAERPFHPRNSNYGLGTEVHHLGGTTVLGHGGFLPGFTSVLWYVPDRDLVIAVLTNDSRCAPADLAELAFRRLPARTPTEGNLR